jgi:hypothetical protein
MRRLLIAVTVIVAAFAIGFFLRDQPYRLRAVGQCSDQAVLAHRDSPYSSITWVVSAGDNYQQLRFFDRVEGGVCLRPSWPDLVALAEKEPLLKHLVPADGKVAEPMPAGRMWPAGQPLPNPGTVSNSAYIRLFPLGVLLNQRLMAAAQGDVDKVRPRILVVGLGSGIGIATLAHHFPLAAITVVDIDQAVVDMVREHFPLLRWLADQRLDDGTPRLRFAVRDARQFIRYDAKREPPCDLIILDAYTSGSTIPPHLMTREFFAQCAAVLTEGGIVQANVIGSYTDEKHLITGGAIRTFRAAGLTQVWNFPVMHGLGEGTGDFLAQRARNNLVVCSRSPLDPQANAAGWERIRAYVPYPGLSAGTFVSASYVLGNTQGNMVSADVATEIVDHAQPSLRSRLVARQVPPDAVRYPLLWESESREVIDQAFRAVAEDCAKHGIAVPKGWNERGEVTKLYRCETDWVLAGRETFRVSVENARDSSKHSGEALTGDLPEGSERDAVRNPTWIIADAPLFTDQMANADIFNN